MEFFDFGTIFFLVAAVVIFFQRYIIEEVQKVYRSQGVNTNDKHTLPVHFDLARLELKSAKVRDLWAQKDIGTARERVSATLAPHACLLYSLTPV